MEKPIIAPGSMLNTSEGLLATGVAAALTQQLTMSPDWRVQAACALGLALVAATYVVVRGGVKKAATEVEA